MINAIELNKLNTSFLEYDNSYKNEESPIYLILSVIIANLAFIPLYLQVGDDRGIMAGTIVGVHCTGVTVGSLVFWRFKIILKQRREKALFELIKNTIFLINAHLHKIESLSKKRVVTQEDPPQETFFEEQRAELTDELEEFTSFKQNFNRLRKEVKCIIFGYYYWKHNYQKTLSKNSYSAICEALNLGDDQKMFIRTSVRVDSNKSSDPQPSFEKDIKFSQKSIQWFQIFESNLPFGTINS